MKAAVKTSGRWYRFAEEIVSKAGVIDPDTEELLIEAFSGVPRERFVAQAFANRASEDISLPIGYGQTISKPSTVARMLGILGLRRGMRVLEVGCGSGYVSAVMASVGVQVFAIENLGFLAQSTRKLLDLMNLQNILIQRGDGTFGWPEHAPYDAILVSTAIPKIEAELLSQLVNPGGRLVAPVGDTRGQIMTLCEANGEVSTYHLEQCNFVEGLQ